MNYLINIKTNSELISYEALALAFVLASFDNVVQVHFTGQSGEVLSDNTSRVYGMIQSLALYDMPKAWIDDEINHSLLDNVIRTATQPVSAIDAQQFDTVLNF